MNNNIGDYLNLTSTTVLGITGVLTGNITLQAFAFLPAVVQKISSDLINYNNTNTELHKDLKALVEHVLQLTHKNLLKTSKSKANVVYYAKTRINKSIVSPMSYSELFELIEKDLHNETYSEAIDLTHKDITEISKVFIDYFTSELVNYTRLNDFFLKSTLINHEHRIVALEYLQSNIGTHSIPETISDDTNYYCKKFEEPLFLHRKLPEEKIIRLEDVYVLSNAIIEKQYQWYKVISDIVRKNNIEEYNKEIKYNNIADAIKEFIEYKPQEPGDPIIDMLFIEGKAAMGKSSLISWLCWHYINRKIITKKYIGNRRIITIKLRDLPCSSSSLLNIISPFRQLCAYLLKIDENNFSLNSEWMKNELTNSILILEGFDELCMVENIIGQGKNQYFQNLHSELEQLDCNCKIIITSRPEYLNVEQLDFPKAHINVNYFSIDKRKQWIQRYEKHCPITSEIKNMLLQKDNQILEGICDSPLTLYMIVARNIHVSKDSNLWNVYHEIFGEEVYKRDYEKGAPHAISKHKQLLYRLTAEIAKAVTKEQHFYITVDKLLDIKHIRNLLDDLVDENNSNIKSILEDCFGLASYFRISNKNDEEGNLISAVEFYHNNIRDYFYCEYIWLHLEEIYTHLPDSIEDQDKLFISSFQDMFQYSIYLKDVSERVRSKPIDFLESKIRYLKAKNQQADFIIQELNHHYFKRFFGKMLQTGILSHYTYTGNESILDMMACIYSSVYSIYHTIYLPYLDNSERISITETEYTVEIGTSFIYRILFLTSNIHDHSYTKFDGIMLSGIDFMKINFRGCSFKQCLLIGCNFEGCDLRGADFTSASLQKADFRNAIIDETTIFSKNTCFEHTLIQKEQLPYFAPWISEEFYYTDINSVTYITSKR